MEPIWSFWAILAALMIGAISPGPSFVIVARTAIGTSRQEALAAAVGMAVGATLFATAALLGLHLVLTAVPKLYGVLKLAGGLYLIHLATRIWRGAGRPLDVGAPDTASTSSLRKGFLVGLLTQLSNPKTAIVHASVFGALLPADYTPAFAASLLTSILVLEATWYGLVAVVLSTAGPRRAYLRFKSSLDRAAGTVLGVLGIRLLADTR